MRSGSIPVDASGEGAVATLGSPRRRSARGIPCDPDERRLASKESDMSAQGGREIPAAVTGAEPRGDDSGLGTAACPSLLRPMSGLEEGLPCRTIVMTRDARASEPLRHSGGNNVKARANTSGLARASDVWVCGGCRPNAGDCEALRAPSYQSVTFSHQTGWAPPHRLSSSFWACSCGRGC
jgi:hypothetical protein